MEEDTLYLQLHKLPATISEEALDHTLTTLWKTRRTGLRSPEKSHIQTLFNLSSVSELDPNEKYQSQWKGEVSREQFPLPRTSVSYQVKTTLPPSFASSPSSEIPIQLWPRHDDSISRFYCNDLGGSTPMIADTMVSNLALIPPQQDAVPPGDTEILPCLKSMTWTIENGSSAPANRVAVISLKLQDNTKSPSGETEVKFKLTKDTLEAVIRSMTYISEELSRLVPNSSGPFQKKQKH